MNRYVLVIARKYPSSPLQVMKCRGLEMRPVAYRRSVILQSRFQTQKGRVRCRTQGPSQQFVWVCFVRLCDTKLPWSSDGAYIGVLSLTSADNKIEGVSATRSKMTS